MEKTSVLTRIIVADDHPAMLEAIRSLLEPRWSVVATVTDGALLVDMAQRLQPDLIVVDLHMPRLNGIQAVRALKEGGSNARVVFVSSETHLETIAAALSTGANGFVAKSWLYSWLIPAIEEALQGRLVVSAPSTTDQNRSLFLRSTTVLA